MQDGPEDGADDECRRQVEPARAEVGRGEPWPADSDPERERRGAQHEQQHERIPTHLPASQCCHFQGPTNGRMARPCSPINQEVTATQLSAGAMLWLNRNTFAGSYSRFTARRRASFSAPYSDSRPWLAASLA